MKLRFLSFLFIIPYLFATDIIKPVEYRNGYSFDVIAISDAIADFHKNVPDEVILKHRVRKGSWTPISLNQFHKLASDHSHHDFIPGGSGINVIKGLARLGWKCSIVGKIGNDKIADIYIEKLRQLNIHTDLQRVKALTGRCFCLITPDFQRTMLTYLGASLDKSPIAFSRTLRNTRLFHIEGYQLIHPDIVLEAIQKYKKLNAIVSMDLGSDKIIRMNKDFIFMLLKEYVDIVFCNEDEAKELTGLSPQLACGYLSTICHVSVVTMAEKGGWVGGKQGLFYFPAQKANVKDTTGAGDLFASGFLHGFLQGYPLQQCSNIGAMIASFVVEEFGAEISNDHWMQITSYLQNDRLVRGY